MSHPFITSNGGGSTANISLDEGVLDVTTVEATDLESQPLTFSISGGADAALFTIDPITGLLSFVSAADFENPADAGLDGIYDVIVRASDGTFSDTQTLAITIGDVAGVTLDGTADDDIIGEGQATVDDDTINGLAGNDTLSGLGGNDTLDGGLGEDDMDGGEGDDYYFVDNLLDTVTELDGVSGGHDTVESTKTFTLGDFVEDLVLAGAAVINGTGNALDNTITGNSAANVIDGGAGADEMAGLGGNDTYHVDDLDDIVTEAATSGTDRVFAAVSGYALAANVENLFLSGAVTLGIGNTAANYLTGNSSANTLNGLAGNDTIDGGLGADTMRGGRNDDTYIVDNESDNVVELLDEGIDLVNSSVSYSLVTRTAVENLTLTGSLATSATGNDLANELTGNGAANTLTGGNGNDRLAGGAGADTMLGGAGNDSYFVDNILDVATEEAASGVDLVTSTKTYTIGDNIENLTLSLSAAVNGTGNSLNNTLIGNISANTLTGLDGNDKIDGGSGLDTMIGGLGNDTYWVSQTTDVVTEVDDEGTDTVNSAASFTLGTGVDHLTLSGFSNLLGTGNNLANRIIGNFGNNTLTGNGGNDILKGELGADTMIGGDGDDIYHTDNGGDTQTEAFDEGTDTVVSTRASITLSANIEKLTLGGTGEINGTGNELDNTITGNKAKNTIDGGAGDDTINAGAGNDVITGGAGADQMTGAAGTDRFVFSSITDSGTNVGVDTDNILDYGSSEKIDLRLIDAIASTAGVNDVFVADTNGTFVAGEMNAVQSGSTVTVSLYTDSVAGADMVFTIQLGVGVSAVEFLL